METVLIENCWAMYSGYSTNFNSLGDGNGFKAGGHATLTVDKLPDPIPRHTVRFCLAVRNKASGFYANHHIGGINWHNNSAYRNRYNYNMLNRLPDNETDVPGYDHVMRNNLGHKGGTEIRSIDYDQCDNAFNYFDLDVTVSDEDFLSLDEALLVQPRQADGNLPQVDFMKLSPGSDLVDRGEDIGFPYHGTAPDLGAFEQEYTNVSNRSRQQYFNHANSRGSGIRMFPNPVSRGMVNIESEEELKMVRLVSPGGQVAGIFEGLDCRHCRIPVAGLPSGVYYLRLVDIQDRVHLRKLMIQ
jgi:hypothetical protein